MLYTPPPSGVHPLIRCHRAELEEIFPTLGRVTPNLTKLTTCQFLSSWFQLLVFQTHVNFKDWQTLQGQDDGGAMLTCSYEDRASGVTGCTVSATALWQGDTLWLALSLISAEHQPTATASIAPRDPPATDLHHSGQDSFSKMQHTLTVPLNFNWTLHPTDVSILPVQVNFYFSILKVEPRAFILSFILNPFLF